MGYEVSAPKPRGAAGDRDESSTERPIDRFRRGAVGGVIAAGLLGLRDAQALLDEQRIDPTLEVEAPPHGARRREQLVARLRAHDGTVPGCGGQDSGGAV